MKDWVMIHNLGLLAYFGVFFFKNLMGHAGQIGMNQFDKKSGIRYGRALAMLSTLRTNQPLHGRNQ